MKDSKPGCAGFDQSGSFVQQHQTCLPGGDANQYDLTQARRPKRCTGDARLVSHRGRYDPGSF